MAQEPATGLGAEVLIVSPDERKLGLLAGILSNAGALALTAQTAEDAWECIVAGDIRLVVLDFSAPWFEGAMLLRAARSSARTAPIPFLFLTRNGQNLPVLEPIGDEPVQDGWQSLPCPGGQFSNRVLTMLDAADRRRAQAEGEAEPPPRQPKGPDSSARIPVAPATQSMFAGNVASLDVAKIITMLEPLRLTGALRIFDEKRDGEIHFVEGAVRHATMNEMSGPDALFLLFHMKEGRFEFIPGPPCAEATIEGNTMGLLLEGMRQMDEAKSIIKRLQDRRAKGGTTGPLPPVG